MIIMSLLILIRLGIFYSLKITFSSKTCLLVLLAFPWPMLIDRVFRLFGESSSESLSRAALRIG